MDDSPPTSPFQSTSSTPPSPGITSNPTPLASHAPLSESSTHESLISDIHNANRDQEADSAETRDSPAPKPRKRAVTWSDIHGKRSISVIHSYKVRRFPLFCDSYVLDRLTSHSAPPSPSPPPPPPPPAPSPLSPVTPPIAGGLVPNRPFFASSAIARPQYMQLHHHVVPLSSSSSPHPLFSLSLSLSALRWPPLFSSTPTSLHY